MKKLIIIFSILYFVFSLLCGQSAPVAGGWQTPDDNTITIELQEIFDEGYAKYTAEDKAELTPVKLTGTQVVAGTNYKFYCVDSKNVGYTVVIYKNLKDECTATTVEKLDKFEDCIENIKSFGRQQMAMAA